MVKPVLTSRSVLLGELQENHFVAVACGKGPLSKNCYVLTKSGRLCLFDDRRRLDRFTEVKVRMYLYDVVYKLHVGGDT